MLETLAVIIGLAVIFMILIGAGLFSLFLFGGIFLLILFLTKTLLFALVVLAILISPFVALAALSRLCKDRTLPGTNWPLGKAVAVGLVVALVLSAIGVARSVSGFGDFMNDAQTMMEQCDKGGDHSTDMDMGGRHYHFSCKSAKPAPEQHDL